ncbi:25S rRNA (adenine645-N1)-methyltransferase [Coemansia brasiliensis]|uniref:Ribosomal RNA-processing protein 8 n=1 Tax=Coemansia brasiliensis TaxID=2650707 RepID=A0A9W8IDU4_9FUNG|nr:25S rRNA (adenine645-N1)-methyltransferase [Coemansia brasiliensis]
MLASRRSKPQSENKADGKDGSSESRIILPKDRKSRKGSSNSQTTEQESKLSALQEKMQQKLKGARFRWINEVMYTETGDKTFGMVQANPSIFAEYHKGFAAQVQKWPVNPVDVFISQLQGRKRVVVADLGCGEAKLAAAVGEQHTVHSFDLVAHNERITPCNIADVPLPNEVVDVAIFCLALMGTDFIKFVREANRILRMGGELKIAEVVSRIASTEAFVAALEEQGFRLDRKTTLSKMFIMLDLTKIRRCPSTFQMAPGLLKPCIYKRR